MEIVDTLIAIALLVWCVMILSIRRSAQRDSLRLPTPVVAKVTRETRVDTLTDPLGRI
jgi:hypothetical protein